MRMRTDVKDLPGSNAVRLLDVFALGPAMIYVAYKAPNIPSWLRAFVGISGIGTIFYNGINLLRRVR